MRKKLAALAAVAVAVPSVAFLAASSPAQAGCTGNGNWTGDGSVPGTPSRVTPVGPFYVDDRDYPDVDDDGEAGGLWLYYESGVAPGLQRGGDQIAFATLAANGVNPVVPFIAPIVTPAGTLFPQGFGGGSLAQTAGAHDACQVDNRPARDHILF